MKQCFLCSKGHKLKDFSNEVFNKCVFYLKVRQLYGFKYKDIYLSPQAQDALGYHVDCYRKFIAVKRKYTEAFEECGAGNQQVSLQSPSISHLDGDLPVRSCTETAHSTHTDTLESPNPQADKQQVSLLSPSNRHLNIDLRVRSNAETAHSSHADTLESPNPQTDKQQVSLPSPSNRHLNIDLRVRSNAETVHSSHGDTLESPNPQADKQQVSLPSPSNRHLNIDLPVRSNAETAHSSHADTLGLQAKKQQLLSFSPNKGAPHLDTDLPEHGSAGTSQADTLGPQTEERPLSYTLTDEKVRQPDINSNKKEQFSEKTCIFCSLFEKKTGTKRLYLKSCTDKVKTSLLSLALSLKDQDLLSKLETSNILFYHVYCWVTYRNKLRISTETSGWHNVRHIHNEAFDNLSQFITLEILEAENVFFLKDLWRHYQALLCQLNEGELHDTTFDNFTPQHLRDKIEVAFGETVHITTATSCNKIIVYKKNLNIDKIVEGMLLRKSAQSTRLRDTACTIRENIKAIKKKNLPQTLHPDELIEGECEVPETLYEFISTVVKGLDVKRRLSGGDKVKIMSICQDIIYVTTKGRIKPSKQLMLGLTVKSLTNSSKLMTILNRYGHTVSYTTAESLETELAFTAADESNGLVPKSIKCHPGLHTNLAFDNFDRYVETLDGKDTMHDTVGIIYQFQPQKAPSEQMATLEPQPEETPEVANRRRRKFQEVTLDIQPYFKKPKAIAKLSSLPEISQLAVEYSSAKKNAMCRDMLWIFSLAQNSETPMWTGFNCKNLKDSSEIQTLDYLPQINASPTSYSVVHKTMMLAEKVLKETGQNHLILTYDLAIAKMAMQIQVAESPIFDNLFINLGTFHIYLAFFKVLGKYIDGSGIEDIIVQSQVLAAGSLNAFVSGKHYNRCKRIHALVSAAFQILHYQQFLKKTALRVDQIDQYLKDVQEKETEIREPLDTPPLLSYYLQEYANYKKSTLDGEHGKTAQFCLQYTELVDCYHRLNRAIKTSDFYLYTDALFEMADCFFAFNQPNYARWLLKYLDNLLNLKKLKPEIVNQFERGSFGVKRTSYPLSRLPVDLTLEQTINAHAANSRSGILHLTNEISARQRWAITHSIRTKIITELLNSIELSSKDDVSKELRPSRIKKDREDLNKIINTITEAINPFDDAIIPDLINISTGRAATRPTEDFLLNIKQIGENQKKKFIEECNHEEQRFEKPIKRNKIQNFSSECFKKAHTTSNGKTVQLKMERDIFGRLLAVALGKKIDMKECLSFPLAPLPPALCQLNGNMFKTDKSALAKKLISKIDDPLPPSNVKVWIIDGFYFLFSLGKLIPDTFGKLAEFILHKISNVPAEEIHVVFDQYPTPSIKDKERESRGEEDVPFEISGPLQKTPRDFVKSLKNPKFKLALVGFLSQSWANQDSNLIGSKKILLTVEDKCFSYQHTDDGVRKREEHKFDCSHEEADTRIIFHIGQLEGEGEIVINAIDTDILIILLANYYKFSNKKIFLLSGHRLRDVRYTDCAALYQRLGANVCRALPSLHAFTGCDYTASFYRQGKIKALNILLKNEKYQTTFRHLNSDFKFANITEMNTIQEFTSLLYGVKNCNSVNQARLTLFSKTFAKSNNKFIPKIKRYSASIMPPCYKVLKQKLLRTIFVATMWQNATEKNCINNLQPTDYGWIINSQGKYEPFWFEGDPTPLNVDDIVIVDGDNDDESTDVFTSSDDENEE